LDGAGAGLDRTEAGRLHQSGQTAPEWADCTGAGLDTYWFILNIYFFIFFQKCISVLADFRDL
jgi:hypothetical protein